MRTSTVCVPGGNPVIRKTPFASVIPAAVYDTVIAAIAGPIAVAAVARRQDRERLDW
jgi:hypothetical protein